MSPNAPVGEPAPQQGAATPGAAQSAAHALGSSQVDAVGTRPPRTAPAGILVGFVVLALFALGVFFATQEMERLFGAQEHLQASIDELSETDERVDQRFRDFQTTVSRADQEQASSLGAQVGQVRGDSEEGLANLRTRLGRIENSLEALRQEGVKDRQGLGDELKTLEADLSSIQGGMGELAGVVDILSEEVEGLGEVLDGGLSLGGSPGSNGKAPSWAATLTDLKDASAGNRWTAVTALGDTRDQGVIPYLLPMLGDEDVFVRMATARVLGELGSLKAAPALIEALGDTQAAVREAAVVSLRLISGKDFRFDPLGRESDQDKAKSAWRKWLTGQGVSVQADSEEGKISSDRRYGAWSGAPIAVRDYTAGQLPERYGEEAVVRSEACAVLIANYSKAKVYYRGNNGKEYLFRNGEAGHGLVIILGANKGIYHRALSLVTTGNPR